MTSPTVAYGSPSVIVLSSVTLGLWVAVAVAVSVASVSVPPAGVPVPMAMLTTVPASRSAWVTVWLAMKTHVSSTSRISSRSRSPES